MARFPSFSFGGREKSLLQGVEQHLSIVKGCVVTYQRFVAAFAVQDPASGTLFTQVFDLEAKATDIQRDLSHTIAEGAFFGGIREDILNLIGSDNKIADKAKNAARLLSVDAGGDAAFLNILKSEHMSSFQTNLLSSVNALESLIKALQIDKREVLSRVQAVEDYEEAADTEKEHLLRELFKRPRTMDPVSIIQLRDFIFASDDIADYAESASDIVLVLVAKGYG